MDEKNNKIDISIILVNYNSYELTYQTITTLQNFAEGFSYEVIIVDNNSQDGSGKRLQKKFPNFRFILNKTNKGFGKANNQAIKIAKGDFILLLNNDVIFIENTVEKLFNYAKSMNGKFLLAPRLLNSNKSLQFSTYSFQTLWLSFTTYFFLYSLFPKSKYFNKYYLMNRGIRKTAEVETITGAFMFWRRDDILELNGFDEDFFFYGEDNDLCKRFRDIGGKVIYFPESEIIHIKGGTKKSNWFHEENSTISLLKLFNKHYSRIERFWGYLFMFLGNLFRSIFFIFRYVFSFNKHYFNEAKYKLKTLSIIWSMFWQKY